MTAMIANYAKIRKQLRLCPFCKSKACTWGGTEPESWYAECKNTSRRIDCGVLMQFGARSQTEAEAIWNRRKKRIQNEEGILSCPWCGTFPEIIPWKGGQFLIHCVSDPRNGPGKCPVTPEIEAGTKEEAIVIWNAEEQKNKNVKNIDNVSIMSYNILN